MLTVPLAGGHALRRDSAQVNHSAEAGLLGRGAKAKRLGVLALGVIAPAGPAHGVDEEERRLAALEGWANALGVVEVEADPLALRISGRGGLRRTRRAQDAIARRAEREAQVPPHEPSGSRQEHRLARRRPDRKDVRARGRIAQS